MRVISSVVGWFLFLSGTVGCFFLGGGRFPWLFIPLAAIILAPVGSALLAFGAGEVGKAIQTVRFLFLRRNPDPDLRHYVQIVRFLMASTYTIAALISLFWTLLTLAALTGPLEMIAHRFAVIPCSFIYAILLSEGLYRPLKYRLENLQSAPRVHPNDSVA